jgi:hypothetical protein
MTDENLPTSAEPETPMASYEKRDAYISDESGIFSLILARLAVVILYLGGISIIAMSIYQAFFDIKDRDTYITIYSESLVALAGAVVILVAYFVEKRVR